MRLNEVVSLSNSITDISDDLYNLLRDMMAAIEASKEESA